MLIKDLKTAKAKLETDIGCSVIKLLNEFNTKTDCNAEGVELDFHQVCEPTGESRNVITNVKVILVI